MGYRLNPKKISKLMSFLKVFGSFSIKNFARVMSLLFGSARAHTYLKSGQVVPPSGSPRKYMSIEGQK